MEISGQVSKWIRPGDQRSWIDPAITPPLLTKIDQRQAMRQAGCLY